MIERIRAGEILEKVRSKNPIVHNITNYVVMNWTANCLLSVGASPVMTHAVEEMESMVDLAKSLVINIGTLSPPWIESMKRAMRRAKERGIPIVFDPVGVGATPFRTETARFLVKAFSPTVIRGNASEIISIFKEHHGTKGVDSIDPSKSALEAATALSKQFNCIVCVSGEVDYVVDESHVIEISNGHPIMTRVTGLGCASTALIAAFLSVHESSLESTASAMTISGIAGELAAAQAKGPGSFQTFYLDALYSMNAETITARQRVRL